MGDAGGQMPLCRAASFCQIIGGHEHGINGDHLILIAMGQKHRCLQLRHAAQMFRPNQHPRKADDGCKLLRPAQADMQGHHRALAKTHQCHLGSGQIIARQLRVQKSIELRGSFGNARPAFVGCAVGQWKPLPAHGGHAAGFRRVGRHKAGIWQPRLPLPPDVDQVFAISAIAVQKHDDLPCRARFGRKARAVEKSGHVQTL